jgi:hypothetical protein
MDKIHILQAKKNLRNIQFRKRGVIQPNKRTGVNYENPQNPHLDVILRPFGPVGAFFSRLDIRRRK